MNKKIMISVAVLSVILLSGCSGSTQPLLNANSNKTEILSMSRLFNITNITYTNAFNSKDGTITQMKD